MLHLISCFFLSAFMVVWNYAGPIQKTVYRTNKGNAKFISVAPLETIKAESHSLKGIIDTFQNTFAFSININSFQGFNSALQEQHFYENYMETDAYPLATFSGKIIELIDYATPGTYAVRAKGVMNLHGVKVERIIKSSVTVKQGEMQVRSSFVIPLTDHNIKIPRIVNQKISSEIQVEILAALKPENI